METEDQDFGELDGEAIRQVVVKVTGGSLFDRRPAEGEPALLMIQGTFGSPVVKRINGVLVREHTVKAQTIAEPVDQLADEVDRFISEVDDRRQNRQQLPFEDQDDQDDQDGDQEPEDGA